MQQTLEHLHQTTPSLIVSGRKKARYPHLIAVTQGACLVRVGKHHHLLRHGDLFWVNQDCLTSTIALPGAAWHTVSISPRTQLHFPNVAGLVESPLAAALLEALLHSPSDALASRILDSLHQLLSEIEVLSAKRLAISVERILAGEQEASLLSRLEVNEQQFIVRQLQAAEIIRLSRSGQKFEKIAKQLKLSVADVNALHQEAQ